MSSCVLIIGESGSGKSTSLRNLDPKSTYIINILDKGMPFRGGRRAYKYGKGGNMFHSYKSDMICRVIKKISDERPEITTIVIDDWQYVMAYEFMDRSQEPGWGKFTDIGKHGWDVLHAAKAVRKGVNVFILSHSELKPNGMIMAQTMGKMIDEKAKVESLFLTVLHSIVKDGEYFFLTQTTANYMAKSPMGMLEDHKMDNDLQEVIDKTSLYDEAEKDFPAAAPEKEEAKTGGGEDNANARLELARSALTIDE